MTAEEFDTRRNRPGDDRYRYELIQRSSGRVADSKPVSDAEADPNDDLGHMLRQTFKESHPLGGRCIDGTLPEQHGPGNSKSAPWPIGRSGRGSAGYPNTQRDIPSIVVEFVSAQTARRHSRLRS